MGWLWGELNARLCDRSFSCLYCKRPCSEAGSHLSTFRTPGESGWSPSHREGFPTWRSSGLASREFAAQAVTGRV